MCMHAAGTLGKMYVFVLILREVLDMGIITRGLKRFKCTDNWLHSAGTLGISCTSRKLTEN